MTVGTLPPEFSKRLFGYDGVRVSFPGSHFRVSALDDGPAVSQPPAAEGSQEAHQHYQGNTNPSWN